MIVEIPDRAPELIIKPLIVLVVVGALIDPPVVKFPLIFKWPGPAAAFVFPKASEADTVAYDVVERVVNAPVEGVVAPTVVPLIEPPVIAIALEFCVEIVPRPETSVFAIASRALTCDAVKAMGVAEIPVLLPIMEFAAKFAILAKVTAPELMVVANEPVPVPVTSLVKVIVWSPVLVPEELPEKLLAERAPAIVKAPADVILFAELKN